MSRPRRASDDATATHPLRFGLLAVLENMRQLCRSRRSADPSATEIEMLESKRRPLTSLKPRPSGTGQREDGGSAGSLAADIIIANAPDPVFVSDLQGKILQ